MPNIGSVLKSEISRVSRKEIKSEIQGLKKLNAQYRGDIAQLKKRLAALELATRKLAKTSGKTVTAEVVAQPVSRLRFVASSFASQRKRLGLTAVEMGQLLGVSDQSVNKWEQEKAVPRQGVMPAIAHLKTLTKKTAQAVLAGR